MAGLNERDFSAEWDADGFLARAPLGLLPEPTDYVAPYLRPPGPASGRTMTGAVIPCYLGPGIRRLRPTAADDSDAPGAQK